MGWSGISCFILLYVRVWPHGVTLAPHLQCHGHRLPVPGVCIHHYDAVKVRVGGERAEEARAPGLVVNPDLRSQASPRTRNSWACAPWGWRTLADRFWTVTAGGLTTASSIGLKHPAPWDVRFPVSGVPASARPEDAQRVRGLGVPSHDFGGVIHVSAL